MATSCRHLCNLLTWISIDTPVRSEISDLKLTCFRHSLMIQSEGLQIRGSCGETIANPTDRASRRSLCVTAGAQSDFDSARPTKGQVWVPVRTLHACSERACRNGCQDVAMSARSPPHPPNCGAACPKAGFAYLNSTPRAGTAMRSWSRRRRYEGSI